MCSIYHQLEIYNIINSIQMHIQRKIFGKNYNKMLKWHSIGGSNIGNWYCILFILFSKI